LHAYNSIDLQDLPAYTPGGRKMMSFLMKNIINHPDWKRTIKIQSDLKTNINRIGGG